MYPLSELIRLQALHIKMHKSLPSLFFLPVFPCFVIVPFSIHRLIFSFHRNRSSPKTLLAQHVFDWPAQYFIKETFLCIKYSLAGKKNFPLPLKKICQVLILQLHPPAPLPRHQTGKFCSDQIWVIFLLKHWLKYLQVRCAPHAVCGKTLFI